MTPYWQDELVTLYCGDAMDILPQMRADAIVTDPPYGETSLKWDRWPDGWLEVATSVTNSMWCFGSLRMFMNRADEFLSWKLSQDVIWEKHNGTSPFADRFRRVHEVAAHFYRGAWSSIYKVPQFTFDAKAKTVQRKTRPPQWGSIAASRYSSVVGGPRLMRSVLCVRSCHGSAIHPTQKPEGIVTPLIDYAVPPKGIVVDCFAGSGTILLAARNSGRRAIGIEKNEEYCKLIVKRLSKPELETT